MAASGYEIKITYDLQDTKWDTFVTSSSNGQYEQTSLWAQVKALYNWKPVRVLVSDAGEIVAGAQILLRRVSLMGAVGYVSKGPVFAHYDRSLVRTVINELKSIAKDFRIQYLILNPSDKSQDLEFELKQAGVGKGSIVGVVSATVIIDLRMDLDDILARIKRKTRYDIRYGAKKGVIVREGKKEEIGHFFQMMLSTCRRQKVAPNPPTEAFFQEMWRIFSPHDYVKLFVAEVNGEILSYAWVVAFRDTVRVWKVGWSGKHGNLRPNHVLYWEIIKWAKKNKYRYFDFVGLDPNAAQAVLQKRPLSEKIIHGPSYFKLRFGGKVVMLPGAYEYIYTPIFRWGYNTIFPRIKKSLLTHKILKTMN